MPIKDIKNLRVSSNDPFNTIELPEHWGSVKVYKKLIIDSNKNETIKYIVNITDIYNTYYYWNCNATQQYYDIQHTFKELEFSPDNIATISIFSKHKISQKSKTRRVYNTFFRFILNPDTNTITVNKITVYNEETRCVAREWYDGDMEFSVDMIDKPHSTTYYHMSE